MIGFNRSILGVCVLFAARAMADDIIQGGVGAVPAPVNSSAVHFISGRIVIEGDRLIKQNKSAYWRYQCQYGFYNPNATELTVQMAQPFIVRNRDFKMLIPKGRFLGEGEPLLYDFTVRAEDGKVKVKSFSSAATQDSPEDFGGAYFWQMPFHAREQRNIGQTYRTGVSLDNKENVRLNFTLRTVGLWEPGNEYPLHLEVRPNTPTRLCHERQKEAAAPNPLGLQVIGDKSQRRYVWNLPAFHPQKDLQLCFQTTHTYIRSHVVEPIVDGRKNEALAKMSLTELDMLRDSIYAQYGRVFADEKIQRHFASLWWYEPNPKFSARMLTREDLKALRSINYYERSLARQS